MENIFAWFAKACLISVFFLNISFSQMDSTNRVADLQNASCSLYKLSLGIGAGTMDVSWLASFTYDFMIGLFQYMPFQLRNLNYLVIIRPNVSEI
jgi:hypothetical protein